MSKLSKWHVKCNKPIKTYAYSPISPLAEEDQRLYHAYFYAEYLGYSGVTEEEAIANLKKNELKFCWLCKSLYWLVSKVKLLRGVLSLCEKTIVFTMKLI